jgi:hypothetical protein
MKLYAVQDTSVLGSSSLAILATYAAAFGNCLIVADIGITSWSITTDVSRSPLVGSATDALIDHSIEICTKLISIDPRCAHRRFGKGFPRCEPARPNGPQLCHRCAVAGDHDRSTRLHFTKHGCRLITKLSLSDHSVHAVYVAHV